MITETPQYSLKDAKKYFREHLTCGDYYTGKKTTSGEWIGVVKEKLELNSIISEKDFVSLCEGKDPRTGEFLTLRNNSEKKKNGETKNKSSERRIFYDFVVAPPKSVSIVACMENKQVQELHDECAKKAMKTLEEYASTRVRKGGANYNRRTGNMLCGVFRHDTNRALDPHLHSHCLVFNATYDEVEKQWKAIENRDMLKAQEYANKIYLSELSKGLRKMGYELDFTAKKFEIRGIGQEMIDKFSKEGKR